MKLSKWSLCLLVMLFIGSSSAFAQKGFTGQADAAYESGSYYGAIEMYQKAYAKEKNADERKRIIFQIGASYYHLQDNPNAEEWLDKAEKAGYSNNQVYLMLADVYRRQGNYDDALTEYREYAERVPNDPRGQQGVESCIQAKDWLDNPTRWKVEPEPLLNSPSSDFSPTWGGRTSDEIVFTSTRENSSGNSLDPITGQNFSSIYYSKRDNNGRWSTPVPLDETINAEESNEGSASMNQRRNTMYFTRCQYEKKDVLGCAIYTSKKRGRSWDVAEKIPLAPADSMVVGHPSIGFQDEYLFFAADLPGGYGGKDIWYSTYDRRKKSWSAPVNLGEGVNTAGHEMFPFIHNSGRLYFASDGHPGMGGLDIFYADREGEEKEDWKWGEAVNMKSPINSSSNDFGIVFEPGANRGYLTSDRKGSRGGDDIWSFRYPPLKFELAGTVKDLVSGQPIGGATVALVGTDGTSFEKQTDEMGYYEFIQLDESADRYIKENTSYQLTVSMKGYLNAKGQESTVGVEQSTRFTKDFALQPITEKEITFPEVRYDLGKWELQVNDSVNSRDSLDYLYKVLVDNPTIVIELMAHTDSRDTDERNKVLSQKRAQSCVDYLKSKGIAEDRMVPKGYGEEQLIISDEEIAKLPTRAEKEAAHQKNRRTTFRIIRDDYVPLVDPEEGVEEEE